MTLQTVPIAFVDTETTSLHPRLRKPWEIGIIRRDPDGTTSETLLQVSDIDLADADPTALRIGGFYQRYGRFTADYEPEVIDRGGYVERGERVTLPTPTMWVTSAEAARIVERELATAVVVGANPQFDTVTLEPLLVAHGKVGPWHYRPVCIEAIAYGWLLGQAAGAAGLGADLCDPEIPIPWKSDHLGDLLGVEAATEEDRHTALGDARWVMRMWDAIHGGAR